MSNCAPSLRRLVPVLLSALFIFGAIAPASAQAPDDLQAAMAAGQLPEPVTLKDADVKGLIRVGKELKELGVSFENGPGSPSLDEQIAGQSKAMDILSSANFTPERMQQVAYSVGLAMATLEKDFEQARGQLVEMQKMKDTMAPEQWAQMQKMMGPAMKMLEQAINQPKGNIALARKYESELRALGD